MKFWLVMGSCLVFLVGAGFHGYAIAGKLEDQISNVQNKLDFKVQEARALAKNNETLKDKLDRAATYQTPEEVRTVSKYYMDKYFGKDAPEVEKVMDCESGWDNRRDHKNKDGSLDMGLYQIHDEPTHRANMQKMYGVSLEIGAHDFDISSKYAKFLWDRNKNNWVCYQLFNK